MTDQGPSSTGFCVCSFASRGPGGDSKLTGKPGHRSGSSSFEGDAVTLEDVDGERNVLKSASDDTTEEDG